MMYPIEMGVKVASLSIDLWATVLLGSWPVSRDMPQKTCPTCPPTLLYPLQTPLHDRVFRGYSKVDKFKTTCPPTLLYPLETPLHNRGFGGYSNVDKSGTSSWRLQASRG